MARQLERRLSRIESAVVPKPVPTIHVIDEPGADCREQTWRLFERSVHDALAAGDQVVVVGDRDGDRRIIHSRVDYVDSHLCAMLSMLASKRSAMGHVSALDDVVKSLRGIVIVPTPLGQGWTSGVSEWEPEGRSEDPAEGDDQE